MAAACGHPVPGGPCRGRAGVISIDRLHYTYPGSTEAALAELDLDVAAGDRMLVGGVSGSGKSTLLRSVNGLVPHFYGGRFGGRVVVDGLDTRVSSPRLLAAKVGTVFQDSQARFLTNSIEEEIGFSLELARISPAQVRRQAIEIATRMGLTELRSRRLERLSAGERARLGIAAALGRDPAVLVLDEPLTHLDPAGARAVVRWVRELSHEDGLTAIIAEHRQEWWRGQVSHVIQLDAGRIRQGGSTEQPVRAYPPVEIPYAVAPSLLKAEDLRLAFNHRPVLDGVNLSIEPGEILALIGRNGSGKTTLLRCLTGLQRPAHGAILLDETSILETPVFETARKIGYVPQPPSSMLFSDTVREEVELTARIRNGNATPGEEVQRWAEALDLVSLWDRHPRDLSAGERQRVALAAVLVGRPSVVLLDEPTLGMDGGRMAWLGQTLQALREAGAAVVVATHDAAFVVEAATRAVMLDHGRIVAEGDPAEVLGCDPDFTYALELARTGTAVQEREHAAP